MRKLLQTHLGHRAVFIMGHILQDKYILHCYITLTVVSCCFPPFPQIDIIGDVVIVWRVRGKTIRSVLCNIVCNNCAQCDAHTYELTNSSLDWVLSHWAHFTVLRFIFACLFCVYYRILYVVLF